MTFRVDFQIANAGLQHIQKVLQVLPKSLRNGAMRVAGRKAAKIVQDTVRALVPISRGKPKGHLHLRQGIVSKVKTYKDTIFAVVGPKTNSRLFHAHLIEFGTAPRFTRHTSRYKEIGTKRIKTRTRNALGQARTGYRTKRIRKTLGSFLDQRKLAKGAVRYTGVQKAYRYMSRGWQIAQPRVVAAIEQELGNALAKVGVTV